MSGRCRFCGCTTTNECPGGCSWVDSSHTLCSQCTRIARAWTLLTVSKAPNMRRAFARGFMAASGDPRFAAENPYQQHTGWADCYKYFELGKAAAA